MSSNTKAFEDKMKSAVEHLERELKTVRAGRANPGVLDKVTVDYYGSPTPIQQVASVAVSEARTLTITPWDRTLLRAISKAILASDVGINPIDDGQTIRLNFPAPTEERRKQLAKEVAKLGEEAGVFDYADVVNALCDKLVYRHPHIYGEVHADTPEEVKANWEALKLRKKNRRSGTLGGVPVSLPALVKAYRIGEKAAATGFDWEKKEDVWAKVKEETAEVEAEMTSGDRTAMEEEFGDLLFALVNACRLYGIDPESALERSNKKFMNRFNYMEECASSEGHTLHELSLDRMEELWQQAKHAAAEKE